MARARNKLQKETDLMRQSLGQQKTQKGRSKQLVSTLGLNDPVTLATMLAGFVPGPGLIGLKAPAKAVWRTKAPRAPKMVAHTKQLKKKQGEMASSVDELADLTGHNLFKNVKAAPQDAGKSMEQLLNDFSASYGF